MRYALYAIAALVAVGAVLTIATVGKPRKPVTPGVAAWVAVWNAAIVVVLVLAAGQVR